MSSKLTWNQQKLDQIKQKTMEALVDLGQDTAQQARDGAPFGVYPPETKRIGGSLINSIRVTSDNKDVVYVLAGGKVDRFSVPYARRREYENNLHPNRRFFMKNAMEWAKKNYLKYFKGVTK